VVLDAAAGLQVVLGQGGGVGRRAPPAIELARIRPQLPHALGWGVELGVEGQAQGPGILVKGGYGLVEFLNPYQTTSQVRMVSWKPFSRSDRDGPN
jgi:hypothetical protein